MFYFSYYGGKKREFQHIKPYIDFNKINKIVEPFCGSCAVSIEVYKEYPDLDYHVNDRDDFFYSLLKDIKENGSKKYFDYVNNILKNYTKETHNEEIKKYKKTPTLENYFFYCKIHSIHRGVYDDRRKQQSEINYNKYIKTDNFFKHATLTNLDFLDILNKYIDDENAFIFLDPPYNNSFNDLYSGINYKTDIIDYYVKIKKFIDDCKCSVLMIVNDNAIIRLLFESFILKEYNKQYTNTILNNKTIHLIIGKNL